MKIDEEIYETIIKAQSKTNENYVGEIFWRDAENLEGYIEEYKLINIIQDLICEIGHKEEELEDLKRDMEDNYVQVSIADQVEVYDRDFID